MLKAGKITEATDDEVEQRYQMLCAVAADAGYEHYEISNFALPGRKAVHNSGYWTGYLILDLGPPHIVSTERCADSTRRR